MSDSRLFVAPSRRRLAVLALALAALAGPFPALAQSGTVTGLPVPRYVSLKADRVNLREGPSKDHRTSWVFQRAGLPVEIVAEFETWRRIRDSRARRVGCCTRSSPAGVRP